MASSDPTNPPVDSQITTFTQAELERFRFGSWLSGFTDGEGCFILYFQKMKQNKSNNNNMVGAARFCIALRRDDTDILLKIYMYLGCGFVRDNKRLYSPYIKGENPQTKFQVDSIVELHNNIVPHFDEFPLEAKKKRDFDTWKIGVDLLFEIASRKFPQKPGIGSGGRLPKWTTDDLSKFEHIMNCLKEGRKYSI